MAYQQTEDEKDLEYAYFGIFDGHGGREAAVYAKEHLMDHIVRQKGFWSDDDDTVLRAIHEGFVSTHHAMWRELGKNFVRRTWKDVFIRYIKVGKVVSYVKGVSSFSFFLSP